MIVRIRWRCWKPSRHPDARAGAHPVRPNAGLAVLLLSGCRHDHGLRPGLFASPERNLVFDVNDFDETLPGPWEWDVKRLLASLAVAGRSNGFDASARERVVRAAAEAYRLRMLVLAEMRELDLWCAETSVNDALIASVDPTFGRQIRRTAAKARSRSQLQALAQLTRLVDGRRRLASDPPLVVPIDELVGAAEAHAHEQHLGVLISTYMQSLDAARRMLISRSRSAATPPGRRSRQHRHPRLDRADAGP